MKELIIQTKPFKSPPINRRDYIRLNLNKNPRTPTGEIFSKMQQFDEFTIGASAEDFPKVAKALTQ